MTTIELLGLLPLLQPELQKAGADVAAAHSRLNFELIKLSRAHRAEFSKAHLLPGDASKLDAYRSIHRQYAKVNCPMEDELAEQYYAVARLFFAARQPLFPFEHDALVTAFEKSIEETRVIIREQRRQANESVDRCLVAGALPTFIEARAQWYEELAQINSEATLKSNECFKRYASALLKTAPNDPFFTALAKLYNKS